MTRVAPEKADEIDAVGDAGDGESHVDDALIDGVSAGQGGGWRQLHDGDQVAAVLIRNETDRRLAEFIEAERDQAGINDQHDRREADGTARNPSIAARELVEAPVEGTEEGANRPGQNAVARMLFMRLQQKGAERGRQRQRHDQRDDGGASDRQSELAVELAGNTRDERGRHEHGAQYQSDGDERRSHFLHGPVGGFSGLQPIRHVALDVLDDDDRVVDDDADGEHETEQRQVVQ